MQTYTKTIHCLNKIGRLTQVNATTADATCCDRTHNINRMIQLKPDIRDHILKINKEGESRTAISGYLRQFQTVGRCHPPHRASQ